MDWLREINGDPIAWLLEPEDSGVRYLALRDLLNCADSDAELQEARKEAYRTGPIRAILDHMEPEGYWERPGPGYNPKYRSTVWSMILLAQLGASVHHDRRVAQASAYLLENSLTENGQFTASGSPSGTADCLQGNLCDTCLELGVEDERLEKAFDWMARSVTGEGVAPKTEHSAPIRYYAGNCGTLFACGSNLNAPCAWGGTKVLMAFGKLPPANWTDRTRESVEMGTAFFFSVDPASANYPSPMAGKPSGNWWKFGFPVFYITDLLQLVEALARTGRAQDPRLQNSLNLVLSKQDENGCWSLDYNYAGKIWCDFGAKKAPNKWVTLRALRTIKIASSASKIP